MDARAARAAAGREASWEEEEDSDAVTDQQPWKADRGPPDPRRRRRHALPAGSRGAGGRRGSRGGGSCLDARGARGAASAWEVPSDEEEDEDVVDALTDEQPWEASRDLPDPRRPVPRGGVRGGEASRGEEREGGGGEQEMEGEGGGETGGGRGLGFEAAGGVN